MGRIGLGVRISASFSKNLRGSGLQQQKGVTTYEGFCECRTFSLDIPPSRKIPPPVLHDVGHFSPSATTNPHS